MAAPVSGERTEFQALVVAASPREDGRSERLARAVEGALEERGAEAVFWSLATRPVRACTGCGACSTTGECPLGDAEWSELEGLLEGVDALFLAAPLYFSGPTAQLAAMLSRCQVFWSRRYELSRTMPPERPAHLFVVGEGGDPFGSAPLETIVTSSLNSANLRVSEETTHRFVGAEYRLERIPGVVGAALEAAGFLPEREAR